MHSILRKVTAALLCLTMAITLCCGCSKQAESTPSQEKDIVILYTNDVHCGVSGDIGYAGLAALKKQYLAAGNEVVLVDAGDAIQGDIIGMVGQGENIVRLMNAVGYDVVIPGNHEFDYGALHFFDLVKQAEFPYLSCNLTYLKTGERVFDATKLMTFGDTTVAFIGMTTPNTTTSTAPSRFEDENGEQMLDFARDADGTAFYTAVQNAVDAAKKAGADYVIAVGHMGSIAAEAPWTSADVIRNTNGIDAFIDGHSHTVSACDRIKNKDGAYVLCTQTGTKMEQVGMLLISKEGNLSTGLISEAPEQDAEITALLEKINADFTESMNTVVAQTDIDLTVNQPDTEPAVRIIRNAETNLGDLVADACRSAMGADVALMNGGGIRASLQKGDITYGNLYELLPFGNKVCMIEATGRQILDCIEFGLCTWPEENGSFMQVSGISYQIDTSVASAVKTNEDGTFAGVDGAYRAVNVQIGDAPIDLNKTYTLAGINYILTEQGSGMTMFNGCTVLRDDGVSDIEVLTDYITNTLGGKISEGYTNPFGQERITALEQ